MSDVKSAASYFGALAQEYEKFVRDVKAGQEELFRETAKAEALLPEALKEGAITQDDYQNARLAIEEAKTHLENALDSRYAFLKSYVEYMGKSILNLEALRSQIVLGEVGLAELDAMLEGIGARYREVYRKYFESHAAPPQMFDLTGWAEVERKIEGPIFWWSYSECHQEWSVPSVPPCSAPDGLDLIRAATMVAVAAENQKEIIEEFPVIAFLDTAITNGAFEEYEAEAEALAASVAVVTNTISNIAKAVEAASEVVKKTAQAAAGLPPVVLLGLAGVALYTLGRRKR